jgi:hypothetical protein
MYPHIQPVYEPIPWYTNPMARSCCIQYITAIKKKGWFLHGIKYFLPVVVDKLIPFRQNSNTRILTSLVGILKRSHAILVCSGLRDADN